MKIKKVAAQTRARRKPVGSQRWTCYGRGHHQGTSPLREMQAKLKPYAVPKESLVSPDRTKVSTQHSKSLWDNKVGTYIHTCVIPHIVVNVATVVSPWTYEAIQHTALLPKSC